MCLATRTILGKYMAGNVRFGEEIGIFKLES